jgi:hypothetical protein
MGPRALPSRLFFSLSANASCSAPAEPGRIGVTIVWIVYEASVQPGCGLIEERMITIVASGDGVPIGDAPNGHDDANGGDATKPALSFFPQQWGSD